MKRYEDFNKMFKADDTAERQAVGMMLEKVKEIEEVEFDEEEYLKYYDVYLSWLNEKVGG